MFNISNISEPCSDPARVGLSLQERLHKSLMVGPPGLENISNQKIFQRRKIFQVCLAVGPRPR